MRPVIHLLFWAGFATWLVCPALGLCGADVPKKSNEPVTGPTIVVEGDGLSFVKNRDGSHLKRAVIEDKDVIEEVVALIQATVADGSTTVAPHKLSTSMELNLTFSAPDFSVGLLTSALLRMEGGKWIRSEKCLPIIRTILRHAAAMPGNKWSEGAVSTPWPTRKEKEEMIDQIVRSRMVAPHPPK